MKIIHENKKSNHKWIKDTARGLLDININKLSDKQIRILRNLYLDNLRDDLKPRDAMKKAYEIVKCFKT